MKLTMGKARKTEDPYLIITDSRMPGWEWRVLKGYSSTPDKLYARWLCAVSSPYTFGGSDWGDTYISDTGDTLVWRDPSVADAELPARFRS